LMESWKEMGVPLHVALRGIERAFDSYESKPRKRSVKSLFYCQEEVEAQFAEWQEAQVGKAIGQKNGDHAPEESADDSHLPFSRASILEHLERVRDTLLQVCSERKKKRHDDLCDALTRAVSRLGELEEDFKRSARPDAERLEESLTGLEKMLDEALLKSLSPNELMTTRAEAEEQLQPYRSRMERATFEQTLDNLLLKRLRDAHRLPRLSLFYL
jgi:hypothetical protein